MRGGKFDQRIRIDHMAAVIDPDYGPQPGAWAPFKTLWAEVQDVLPSRAEAQGQGIRIANRPARIRTRYAEGITSAMKVILLDRGGRELKIVSGPVEMGRREGLEFMAEEFTTTGEAA